MKTKIEKRAYPPSWSRFCVKLLIRQNEHPLRYRKTGNAEMDLFFYFCSTAHCSYAEYRMAFVFSSIHVAAAAHVVWDKSLTRKSAWWCYFRCRCSLDFHPLSPLCTCSIWQKPESRTQVFLEKVWTMQMRGFQKKKSMVAIHPYI